MELRLIEQLLNSKIPLKKIKFIVDNLNKSTENLDETTTANTNGLRILSCLGCHKCMFEDKFMLNKTSKRYRSCINCVIRAKNARCPKKHNIDNTNLILATCDKIDSTTYNIEPNIIVADSVKIKPKKINNTQLSQPYEDIKPNIIVTESLSSSSSSVKIKPKKINNTQLLPPYEDIEPNIITKNSNNIKSLLRLKTII